MGKLTLLLALAAVVGGSILTLQTRGALGELAQRHAEDQEDVLAREIAESGRSLALSRMMGVEGFVGPALLGAQRLSGGTFTVALDSLSSRFATLTVTATYGGATHTLRSSYAFDPMHVPGPLWIDAPYATAAASPGASVVGNADAPSALFDRRSYDALRLGAFLPFSGLTAGLGGALATAGNRLGVPAASAWAGDAGLLEDLNVDDTEGLYQAVLASIDANDTVFPGGRTVTGSESWGNDGSVTLVRGDLTVEGTVRGEGALVVRGALRVPPSGRLEWEGLVLVRDTTDVLPIELEGAVVIDGAIAVAHDALPPGGHLDVSVYRHAGGMRSSAPQGDVSARVAPWNDGQPWPWHQHTHAFDITPVGAERGRHVQFLEGGGPGPHEHETQFDALVRTLGDEAVYLEFANVQNHGFARFTVDVDGLDGAPFAGTVRTGFGALASADSDVRSETFEARDLRTLRLDVLSLRSLRQAFDTDPACGQWPVCIGYEWGRKGALALRLVRASDRRRLYEATFYWHMRADEKAAHDAEEEAWRARVQGGMAFGTRLALGSRVALRLDVGEVMELADKLGFDGNEIVHLASASDHETPVEARAAGR